MDMTYDVKDLAKRYPDVEKLRLANLRRAWRNIVIYELAVFAVVLLSLDYIGELYDTAVRNSEGVEFLTKALWVLAILALLPPWFFASTERLYKKTRQGTVIKQSFQKRVSDIDRTKSGRYRPGNGRLVWSAYIEVVYKSKDGKRRRLLFQSKSDEVLREGTEFVKYRGLPYPIPVYREKNLKNRYICIKCGRHEKADILECTYCGTSMVHFDF
jgi:hypothetical protein